METDRDQSQNSAMTETSEDLEGQSEESEQIEIEPSMQDDPLENFMRVDPVLGPLAAGSSKKKKCSSVCDVPVEKITDQPIPSACSLDVLNDSEFRGLLDSAMIPRYKKPDEEVEVDEETRRNSDTNENLSVIANHILTELRCAADASTDQADRESDEMYSGLTAFIQDPKASQLSFPSMKRLTKSFSQDSKQRLVRPRRAIYGAILDDSDSSTKGDQEPRIRAHSSEPKLASQTPAESVKPEYTIIDFGLEGCMDEAGLSNEDERSIKYIDEDMPSNETSPSRAAMQSFVAEKERRQEYVQGNIVQELFPMNEETSEQPEPYHPRLRPMDDPLDIENGKFGSERRMECDENSFPYTSGQLRVHGSKHSSYEMTTTPPAIRDLRSIESVQRLQASPALFSNTLVPSNYKPREQFASQFLAPTDNARLSPTPLVVPQESDMTNNCKTREMEEKHRLARQRKLIKKAKETKNLINPETSEGYMGNLATDEILRKLGEDDKGNKAKKAQKSGVLSKDSSRSSKSSNGNGKKNRDKRSSTGKDLAKGSGGSSDSPSPSPKHSMKMNGGISPFDLVDAAELSRASEQYDVLDSEFGKSEHFGKAVEQRSHPLDLGGDGTAFLAMGEDDDEEQYVSADEGVNSVASDEVYHTDELSVSSSHDLMNDAGNFRADDEEVIPNKYSAEEPEFIQVTAKNKKKISNGTTNDKKNSNASISSSGVEKSSSTRQMANHAESINQRRNSAQLTVDIGSGHSNQQIPSPNEHKKFSGTSGRRQLNSLADYIEDSTVHQGKNRKGSHHSTAKVGGSSTQQPRSTNTQEMYKSKPGYSSVLDSGERRNSQPAAGRYAAAVSHSSQGSNIFAAVTTIGVRPSSPQSQLVSPALSSASSSTNSFKLRKGPSAYDPSDERANPPLPSPETSAGITDMTNTACVTVTGGNCTTSSSATRSYAEIAKSKSPVMASSCASDVPSQSSPRDTSPEICTASTSTTNDDRCTSVTSSAGGSVEIIDKDVVGPSGAVRQADGDAMKSTGIDGFSFFYDPNEPTTICSAPPLTPDETETSCEFFSPSTPIAIKPDENVVNFEKTDGRSEKFETRPGKGTGKPTRHETKIGKTERRAGKGEPKVDKSEAKSVKANKEEKAHMTEISDDSKKIMPILVNVSEEEQQLAPESSSGVILQLGNGTTVVFQSMSSGASVEIDRKKKEMMDSAWRAFVDIGPAPVRYSPGVLQTAAATPAQD